MELFTPIETCPLCESPNYQIIRREPINIEGFTEHESAFLAPYNASGLIEFRKCEQCAFCYLDRLPANPRYFEIIYSRITYDFEFEFKYHGKWNIHRDIKRQLRKYRASGALLDIGTWCGTLLESLKDTYQVVGCELDAKAATYGCSVGLDIRTGFYQTIDFGQSFDIITMIDVLEHMPEPMQAVRQVFSMLNEGGLYYLKVPNGQAQIRKENVLSKLGFHTAGASFGYVHINHFNLSSLSRALQTAGFEVLEKGYAQIENHDMSYPFPLKTRIKKWLDNRMVNAVIKSTDLLRRTGVADIGPHLYLIARKPANR
jgi:SAM-dependent methyltransferase